MSVAYFPVPLSMQQDEELPVSVSSAAMLALHHGEKVFVDLVDHATTEGSQTTSTLTCRHMAHTSQQVLHWIQVYRFRLAATEDNGHYSISVDIHPSGQVLPVSVDSQFHTHVLAA
jgi:hypothetical protein